MSLLLADRFYIGDVTTFMMLIKILKTDPEFCIAFDFGARRLDIESMLMAGVIGVGIRLVQGTNAIIVHSPMCRTDRVTFRMDSSAFHQAIVVLNHIPYAYMSISTNEEDDAICLYTYSKDHVNLGSAVVHSLNLEDHDTDFLVTNEDLREVLPYEVMIENPGTVWKSYIQASTIDTVIRYDNKTQRLTWETQNQQTKISLYLPVSTQYSSDIRVCLLPSVLNVLRTVVQVTSKHMTTLSISEDLPVRLFARFDTESFIRVYAGTKDDN
jgi:hypothetical protein